MKHNSNFTQAYYEQRLNSVANDGRQNYPASTGVRLAASPMLGAGLFGFTVGSTSALAENLHEVRDGNISFANAFTQSMISGLKAGVATSIGVGAVRALSSSYLGRLMIVFAATTGISYVLNSVSVPPDKEEEK